MHINTDMDSSDCSTAASASTVYATQNEVAPFAAQVPSFTLPTCSDTLLTPTSASGSPASKHLSYLKARQPRQQQHQQQQHQHHHQHQLQAQQYSKKYSLNPTAAPRETAKPFSLLLRSPPMSEISNHHYHPHHQQQHTPPAVTSSMQYPYDSVPGAGHDAQTSAASGYDISDYSYQTAPRDAGMATTMDEYSFSSYPATAPPVDEGPTTPVYSFAGPVNGSSTYMTSAGRLPPPHPPYSPYSQPNLMPGHAQHSPSLAQPSMPLRPNNYRSGRSADDIHDRVPQMPPMTVGHHGLSATDSAPEHIRTPRTQQPPLGSLATSVNDYHNGSPRSGSDIDSTAKLVEAAIPEEFRNAVLAQGDEAYLHDDCPPDLRFLSELHKKYRKQRGKGMWDTIGAEYQHHANKERSSTARLQMQYTRVNRRYLMWPQEAYSAMIKVYVEEEKNKYARYASRLKELIGTKYHDFKAADVEYFLWRVGFEEHVPEQSPKSRKRKIKKARDLLEKLNEGPHIQSATAPWNSAFANPHMPGHQQYPLPDPNQSMATAQYNYKYNVLADFPTPAFSDEQKDEVVASLAQKYGPIDTDDTMDSNYSDSPGDQTMKNGTPDTSVYQRPMSSPSCNYSTTRNESSRK